MELKLKEDPCPKCGGEVWADTRHFKAKRFCSSKCRFESWLEEQVSAYEAVKAEAELARRLAGRVKKGRIS